MKGTLEKGIRDAVKNRPYFSGYWAIAKYAECRIFKSWETCFIGNFIPIIVWAPVPKIANSACRN